MHQHAAHGAITCNAPSRTRYTSGDRIVAPMPGRIVLVKAGPGDQVEEGQELLVMEAMKMELALKAPRAGTIDSIGAAQGDFVEADAVLVRFAT